MPGFVTQVPRRIRSVAPAISVSSGIGIPPQHVTVEQPAVLEAGGLGLPGQGEGALDRVVGLERETELHAQATSGTGLEVQEGTPHRMARATIEQFRRSDFRGGSLA